ncbi:MAG: hypothetical protein AAF371_13465 [Pseudomonadota bacterium]
MKNLDLLIDLLGHLSVNQQTQQDLGEAIFVAVDVHNKTDFLMNAPFLLDEAIHTAASLEAEGFDDTKELLITIKRHLFVALRLPKVSEFNQNFRTQERLTQLKLIRTSFSAAQIRAQEPLERLELVSDLNDLLAKTRISDMPEYARKVLDMKVRATVAISMLPDHFTDQELRLRVKSIYADFCAEFELHDQKYEDLHEILLRLAKKYGGFGLIALSLGADVTAIAGLLPPPPKALPAP